MAQDQMTAGTCSLSFGETRIAKISSRKKLREILIEIKDNFNSRNPILALVHENGNVLMLGISPEGCYADYVDSSKRPPYFSSLGDKTISREDGHVVYCVEPRGHISEIPKRNNIPFTDLIEVAEAFLITGTRPMTVIEWEMD